MTTETGTIKWFDPARGFGFVVGDGGRDLFFHASEARLPASDLVRGTKVEFDRATGARGPKARDVRTPRTATGGTAFALLLDEAMRKARHMTERAVPPTTMVTGDSGAAQERRPGRRAWWRRRSSAEPEVVPSDAKGWLVMRQNDLEDELYAPGGGPKRLRQRITTFAEIWLTTDGKLRIATGRQVMDVGYPLQVDRSWGSHITSPDQIEDRRWTAETKLGRMTWEAELLKTGMYSPTGPKRPPAQFILDALHTMGPS